jgi:hypothetical protein
VFVPDCDSALSYWPLMTHNLDSGCEEQEADAQRPPHGLRCSLQPTGIRV